MKHQLDDLIEKMEHCDSDLDLYMICLTLLKEVKYLSNCIHNLSDEINGHDL